MRATSATVLLALLGAFLCAGLSPGVRADEEAGEDTAESSAGAAVEPATVVLLDAGAKPRRKLRYAAKAGSTWKIDQTIEADQKLRFGGAVMGGGTTKVRLEATLGITSAGRGRPTEATLVVDHASIDAGQSASAALTEAAGVQDEVFELMEGREVRASFDDRGLLLTLDEGQFDDLPDSLAEVVRAVSAYAKTMVVPFPEEAIGAGASWTVTRYAQGMGVQIGTTHEITLAKRRGKRVDTTFRTKLFAEPQELPSLAGMDLPPGASCRLEKLESGDSGGEATIYLDGLGYTGKEHGSATFRLALSAGEVVQRFGLDMKTNAVLGFEAAPREESSR